MVTEEKCLTRGIDHIGLTVLDLSKTLAFFVECLDWQKFGGDPNYPSAYVTDGKSKVTLWETKTPSPISFDRKVNIGLHHLAFKVDTLEKLNLIYQRISQWPEVIIEFSPENSGKGPKIHTMIYEPGGIRLEFSYDPR